MDINKLFCNKRTGAPSTSSDSRSDYQRDFDRIIFSSAFRRLQNKTQVFPLPGGQIFVHNRLTHSLEVASVGRSIGSLIGSSLAEKYSDVLTPENKELFKHSLYDIISTACLCHDIGNPAFGHSGEDAIANFFIKNQETLKLLLNEKQWADLVNFEGNANAIRILTQQQEGKSIGGTRLTYSSLSAIMKYPCEAIAIDKTITHRKKFGFFQSEKEIFLDIVNNTGMMQEGDNPISFKRHPFVWLVEIADDICYNIVDIEDAHRLNIIDPRSCQELLLGVIKDLSTDGNIKNIKETLESISNKNEKISYLRAISIGSLVTKATELYLQYFEAILAGTHTTPIFDEIRANSQALQEVNKFSIENIYNHKSVVEIENAGYNVMNELLEHWINPIIKSKKELTQAEKKALQLIPTQYLYQSEDTYTKIMGVIDFISGMTDNYATSLYRKIKGIDIGI